MSVERSNVGALPYYGGKHPQTRLCHWISSTMGPTPEGFTYCEPFAGMFGVGLSRPKAISEILNDANSWIWSWWIAARDHHAELIRRLEYTPHSRQLFGECALKVRGEPSGDVVADAVVAHIVLEQGITHGMNQGPSNWRLAYGRSNRGITNDWGERLLVIAERIKKVQLENRDALDILARTAEETRMLIYVDPPYRTAETSPYGRLAKEIDWGRLGELLAAQSGMVAVSGYNDEWDGIGFRRYELAHKHKLMGAKSKEASEDRLEVLWTNYGAEAHIGGLFG